MTNTEEKILSAAEMIFTDKGFAETRMRDIADKAGVNLALINYHFGSKDNLFAKVMLKYLTIFKDRIMSVMHDESTDLRTKIALISEGYCTMLREHPTLPTFIVNELERARGIFETPGFPFECSSLKRQLKEEGLSEAQAVQYCINMFSMLIGTALLRPFAVTVLRIEEGPFDSILENRCNSLPQVLMSMIEIYKSI